MKKKTNKIAVLGILITLGLSGAANAAPVAFKSDANSADYKIAANLFSDYIKKNPSAKLETAVVDLDGKGVGSIIVRIRSKDTCSNDACYTTVLGYQNNNWTSLMERKASTIELGNRSAGVPGANKREIVIDGRETWTWVSGTRYFPRLDSVGVAAMPEQAAPPVLISAAKSALGNLSQGPAAMESKYPVQWKSVELPISIATKAYWVMGESVSVCGMVVGCPSVLLVQSGSTWKPVLTTMAQGKISVLPSEGKNGLHDIAVGVSEGFSTMRFDGKSYQLVATTFPSSVTPSP